MVTLKIGKYATAAVAAIALLAGGINARAVLINPAGTAPGQGTAAEAAGVLVGGPVTVNINGIGDISPSSTVKELVVRRTAAIGTLAAGGLDFYFQIFEAAGNTGKIHQASFNFYGGFVTDFFYDNRAAIPAGDPNGTGNAPGTTAGTIIPDTFGRSPGVGDAAQFFFPDAPVAGGSGPILPGTTSKWLVVRTNATTFGPGVVGILNGISQNINLLGPVPATPEPATFAFGVGIAAVMFGRAGRRRSQQTVA